MTLVIHPLREEDIPKLCELYRQLTGELPKAEAFAEKLRMIEENDAYELFCIYDENDELIATATLTRCPDLTEDCRDYYNMENFVVDEKVRGKGVGKFLLQSLEEYIVQHNGRYMNFTSHHSRKDAHRFYKKNGYDPDYVKGFKKGFPAKENGWLEK